MSPCRKSTFVSPAACMLARATESIARLGRRHELQDLAGPGAEIENAAQRLLADGLSDCGFDRVLGSMQRAHEVPLGSELGEEGLRHGGALLANGSKTLPIGAGDGII